MRSIVLQLRQQLSSGADAAPVWRSVFAEEWLFGHNLYVERQDMSFWTAVIWIGERHKQIKRT